MDKTYTIKQVAELSGLSELLIRAWENRYTIVVPDRTESNRRLYGEKDIEKLSILKKLTDNGYRIGTLSDVSLDQLKNKLTQLDSNIKLQEADDPVEILSNKILKESLTALRDYDSKKIEILLNNASVEFSRPIFLDKIILPLIERIGQYWQEGLLRISHEHLASTIIRKVLSNLIDSYRIDESAPRFIAATPKGQYHELGALIGSVTASWYGWYVTYLGASLPGEEIADVVKSINADILFLSVIYPEDDPYLPSEIMRVGATIPKETKIIFSGNGLIGYKNSIKNIGADIIKNSNELVDILSKIRNERIKRNGA